MPLEAGTKLGNYEILSLVGRGGMGEVYRARDAKLDRDVAIKVLPLDLAKSEPALARFEREAKAIAALAHPNILATCDFDQEQGLYFVAVERPHQDPRLRSRQTRETWPRRRHGNRVRNASAAYRIRGGHGYGWLHVTRAGPRPRGAD